MRGVRSFRSVLIGCAVVVVLALAWAGWWWLASQTVQRGLAAWTLDQRRTGGEVRVSGLDFSGFPWRIRATATDLSVRLGDGTAWHGPGLVAEAPLWQINVLHVRLVGRHEVALPAGLETVTVTVEGGLGRVSLGGDTGFTEVEMALSGLALGPLGTLASLDVTANAPAHAVLGSDETGFMVTVAAEGVHLSGAQSLPLGPDIESLAMTARVMGAPPGLEPAGLLAWSRSGGKVQLDTASLHWGPLALGAEGWLGLDGDLQPVGVLNAEIAGYNQAIDALVAAGWIKPKNAQTAKAVLTGLAPRPQGAPVSDTPTAHIPLSLHDRFVHVGPFRLLPLPPLVWQRPAAG